MTIKAIVNVHVFKDDCVHELSSISFVASPGHIIEPVANPQAHIDGAGCTLIPGLIDSTIYAEASTLALTTFSTFGVTTVIDSSRSRAETQAMRHASRQSPALPSYLTTGPVIGSMAIRYLSMSPYRDIQHIVTAAEMEHFISSQLSEPAQAEFVKIVVDEPGLDENSLLTAVNITHRYGKLAIAHASQLRSYQRALNAGFDMVTPVPMDELVDTEMAKAFAERGIAVTPTLCFLRVALEQTSQGRNGLSWAMENVRTLHKAGVRICAGTSANEAGEMAVGFGQSIHEELELLVEAGLSNAEALLSATKIPCAVFGLRDRGVLEKGKRADMILVDGNPLEDISATTRIRKVWIMGVEVPGIAVPNGAPVALTILPSLNGASAANSC